MGTSQILYIWKRDADKEIPYSLYLIVLPLELMGETFRNHPDIQGITIGGKEHKISQFADTTLFMGFNEENLRRCMDILNSFHSISGLIKINVEKTKVMKFGK